MNGMEQIVCFQETDSPKAHYELLMLLVSEARVSPRELEALQEKSLG